MTLKALLDSEIEGLADVEASNAPDGGTAWSHGGRVFALLHGDGGAADFALDAAVAAAAARTPDVTPSSRGPGWVTFRPASLDDHAADRAAAWFASAHRRLVRV